MSHYIRGAAFGAAALLCVSYVLVAQESPPAPKLKEEMRQPWTRNDTNFLKNWQLAGPFDCKLDAECTGLPGGGAPPPPDHEWQPTNAWGDVVSLPGDKPDAMTLARATLTRAQAGPALLSVGSSNSLRVWLNGQPVLSHDGARSLTPDEQQVEVDFAQGANTLLIQAPAGSAFAVRALERGAVLAPYHEIGPGLVRDSGSAFIVKTDLDAERRAAAPVTVEVVKAGGQVVFSRVAPRGAHVEVNAGDWTEGAYEIRFSTRDARGLLFVNHLPWFKGESLPKARVLAAEAARADEATPFGMTVKMLVHMVEDRLGTPIDAASGNPWRKIHAPLMEFEELMLERRGAVGRVRPFGFVRLAWRDEVDGTPQFCRAYLPAGYTASKKWPTVLQLHGFNPANPVYWNWWSADNRGYLHTETPGQGDILYIEPHGRGNTQYLGMGDADVLRCLAEAKQLLSVDEERVYLTGDSMGGWGTWNVATRHPHLFAAIAPVFGGVDYHSQLTEEQLAALDPVERFWEDKRSTWSMADSLVSMPIYVHHGDRDAAVDVEWSRYGVRMLQRWGYDIRYQEYPGKVHEALGSAGNPELSRAWFLEHRRDANPRKVRIRSAELRNAASYWASVRQAASPLQFMVVDAEVVNRNLIRLDTQNVLDIVLAPQAPLIDPATPVKVVWNGVPHEFAASQAELRLTAAGYRPGKLHKSPALPGGGRDFFATPFAVVIGTTAKDPHMKELVQKRAQMFVGNWREWQKFPPRVFTDREMSDADIAHYSLLLFGGPGENAVAAKLAARLPVRIDAAGVRIDGHAYPAKDAALQMLYPNPRNPARYVYLVAATSAAGMFHVNPGVFAVPEWDYVIVDGHIPPRGTSASAQRLAVVSGMFDHDWRHAQALAIQGDAAIRARGRVLGGPTPGLVLDPQVLARYAGKFQIKDGPLVEFRVQDGRLFVKGAGIEAELLPVNATTFFLEQNNFTVEFQRNASGEFNEFWSYGGREFTAQRVP